MTELKVTFNFRFRSLNGEFQLTINRNHLLKKYEVYFAGPCTGNNGLSSIGLNDVVLLGYLVGVCFGSSAMVNLLFYYNTLRNY